MRYGDEELYKRILKEKKNVDIQKIIGNAIQKKKQHNDIVGFQPNVPAYLTNNPLAMINMNQGKTSQRVLNILLNAGVSACVDRKDVEKAGSIYMNAIDILEKLGYRCNLYTADCTRNNVSGQCDRMYNITKLKTDKEPLNVKKMAFPMAHSGMLRRIGFRWIESCNCNNSNYNSEDDITHFGYGQPIQDNEKIIKDLKKLLKMDFIVLTYQNANKVTIEGALKQLKSYGIELDIEL